MRIAGLVLAVLALLLWRMWPESHVELPPRDGDRLQVRQGPAQPFAAPGIERQVVAAQSRDPDIDPEPPDADLAHEFGFTLEVRLKGPFGLPVEDAHVFLAPDLAGFSRWPETSGQGGGVRLQWRGRQRVMRVAVAVMAWGVLQPMRSVQMKAGQLHRLAFAIEGQQSSLSALADLANKSPSDRNSDVRRVSRDRQRSKRRDGRHRRRRMDDLDILCGRTMVMFESFSCVECHEPSLVSAYQIIARSGLMRQGLHPSARFEDVHVGGLTGEKLKSRRQEEAGKLRRKQLAERLAENGKKAFVEGKVVGVDGRAAAFVPVAWLAEDGTVMRSTTTNYAGRYRLGPMQRGQARLIAGGGAAGMAETTVHVSRASVIWWKCTLTKKQWVSGTAVDEAGEPLPKWRVEFVRDVAGYAAVTQTDKQGRFVIYGVPGPVQCLLWPRDSNSRLPVVFGVEALVDAAPIVLALHEDRPTRGRLRAHAILPIGLARSRVDARVVQLQTGRVARLDAFGFGGAFVAEPLAPGLYRVQLGAVGVGWATRDIQVDGRGLWDIGNMHLAAPGNVRIELLPGAADVLGKPHAFYRRTEAVDVRVEPVAKNGLLAFSPGKHVLVWRDASRVRARGFEVFSGGETLVRIWPE